MEDELLTTVARIATQLPTGLVDPEAWDNMVDKARELIFKVSVDDRLGALLKLADVAYYAAKVELNNTIVQGSFALGFVTLLENELDVSRSTTIAVLEAKYGLHVQGIKDDARERAAVLAAVGQA